MRDFIKGIGGLNFVMLLLVISIIIVSEIMFFQGNKLDAIFIGLWAPTILGFMIYLKKHR
ncbi:hypothetical protein [Zeaxanthinibacter enoshimensis]|uniref:Uncharacterized protein n=1 Tax=Zeaxanthinibacter enoshimensis TaxID=392009 RepID=A0A4R6TGT6_9FLAO|nr:hypothetical protein [Zeaxanthinibacter enoshimensis]TDQ29063.1 hypothetical protein CLV82_2512 [Zeaxanthinibacter enoshimensis]